MKRSKPSGFQNRKTAQARNLVRQSLSESLYKFVQVKPSSSKSTEEDFPDPEQNITENDEPRNEETETHKDTILFMEATETKDDASPQNSEVLHTEEDVETRETIQITRVVTQQRTENQEIDEEKMEIDEIDNGASNEAAGTTLSVYSDIGNWPIPLTSDLRISLVQRGSDILQNKKGPFVAASVSRSGEKTKGTSRSLNESWFYKELPNGEKVLRKWMIYSISKKSIFCFCCRLFALENESNSFVTGFNAWWKLNPKVGQHESSAHHLTCLENWKEMSIALKHGNTIDKNIQKSINEEKMRWREILYRQLDVILFLARQNLSFRGHREDITSKNRGNFLELIKLLSKYDPVLKEHMLKMEHAFDCKKRADSYMSKDIQNEFIILLGNEVKQKIIDDIKNAKYFGIIFDSTPDQSHIDQMSEVIRYVHIEGDQVTVRESFLGFFEISGKTAADLTESILGNLKKDGLDINMCRAQGYDNAATMSGVHSGVQKRIKEINPKALFVPCANHSLNLCGVHSFGSVPSSVTFFGTVEQVYTFFSASTHRWEMLMKKVGVSVKRLVDTRWSAYFDAVKPLKQNFEKLVTTLDELCDPEKENLDTRTAASMLLPAVNDFAFLCYLQFWCDILEEVNATQKYLQTSGVTLERILMKFKALKAFLLDEREPLVDKAINYAFQMCEKLDISVERKGRIKKKKNMPGEKAEDAGLSLKQELQRNMLECLDTFYQEIDRRSQSMENIASIFEIVQPKILLHAEDETLSKCAATFTEIYAEFSADDIISEIKRLRRHIKASGEDAENWTVLQLLQFIVKWEYMDSLPNLVICLKLFLTVCVSVAACERSFSKLKLIKTYLRSTMSQSRLNSLALLSIEKETALKINYVDVIDKFSEIKARRHVYIYVFILFTNQAVNWWQMKEGGGCIRAQFWSAAPGTSASYSATASI